MASDDNRQYTISNTDRGNNNTFAVPGDEDGGAGDDSFPTEINNTVYTRWYIHIENGWDTNVDITVRGSRYDDSAMDAATDDGSAVSVSSGGGTHAFHGVASHSYLEVDANPDSAPTSGDLTVTFQRRR